MITTKITLGTYIIIANRQTRERKWSATAEKKTMKKYAITSAAYKTIIMLTAHL